MLQPRSKLGIPLLGLLMVGAMASGASAQAPYPTKAIQLVVTFSAGGGSDVIARVNAKYLAAEFKVPVNVSNKGGGNQIPGVLSVLNAPPDGYTLLSEQNASSSLHAVLRDLPYNWKERTFGPMLVQSTGAYYVPAKSPWKTLKDVADSMKKNPSSFTWTRLGGTSTTDFSIMKFIDAAGVDIAKTKPVAFEGTGPGLAAVAGGHVQFGFTAIGAILPLYRAGNLRILAVNGEKRWPALPDVPTIGESGFPGVMVTGWYAISGPKGLPKVVLDRLDAAAKKITADPAFEKDHIASGGRPVYMTPEQTRDYAIKEGNLMKEFTIKFPSL